MRAGDFSDLPNPFAAHQTAAPSAHRKRLASVLKLLAVVAIGFCASLFFGDWSQRWLVQRLTADFETLPLTEKKHRLVQVFELGSVGIEPLVTILADRDVDVARTSYDLLREAQNEWTLLQREEAQGRHLLMVQALRDAAIQIPDDRTGWASGLLQQTILESINRSDTKSRDLYDQANETLALFMLADRSGPSVLNEEPFDSLAPKRLTVRAQPLPVDSTLPRQSWTEWPPARGTVSIGVDSLPQGQGDQAVQSGLATRSESATQELAIQGDPGTILATPSQPAMLIPDTPAVYRTASARLQPVEGGQTVALGDIGNDSGRPLDVQSGSRETSFAEAGIRPVVSLVDTPMETFDDSSVIRWLGSPHTALREKAREELERRGFTARQISLADQLVRGDVPTRIGLVDVIARADSIDPRPWLLMLLDDENRDVQLRAISVLATLDESAITNELRRRLVDGQDPIVAARLRRVLDLR